jgi:hypothetical protein
MWWNCFAIMGGGEYDNVARVGALVNFEVWKRAKVDTQQRVKNINDSPREGTRPTTFFDFGGRL